VGTRDAPSDEFGELGVVYAAFLYTYRLALLGDFDVFELEGEDPVYVPGEKGIFAPQDPQPSTKYWIVHFWFYTASLGVTLLMTNLLVGILGNNYDRYEDQSSALFYKERARIICSLDVQVPTGCLRAVFNAATRCLARCLGGVGDPIEPPAAEKCLLAFSLPLESQIEDERSSRSAMERIVEQKLEEKLKPIARKFQEDIQANAKALQAVQTAISEEAQANAKGLKAMQDAISEQIRSLGEPSHPAQSSAEGADRTTPEEGPPRSGASRLPFSQARRAGR